MNLERNTEGGETAQTGSVLFAASFVCKFPTLPHDASQTRFRLLFFTFPLLRASATEGKPRGKSVLSQAVTRSRRAHYTKSPRSLSSAAFRKIYLPPTFQTVEFRSDRLSTL